MVTAVQAPALPLRVSFNPDNLDANTQQLYQSMSDALDGFADVPNDRSNYYSAVNNVNGFVVLGWGGCITNVQPNGNGNLVTIAVTPPLAADGVGALALIIDSEYAEQYQVFADGTFQYVGFLDPLGFAGQMPVGFLSLWEPDRSTDGLMKSMVRGG
jgi:hypothetical protein